jgi:hypothetical protein
MLNILEDMVNTGGKCSYSYYWLQCIRSILESLFKWSGLGLCLKYNSDPGHIFSFRQGGAKAGLRILII